MIKADFHTHTSFSGDSETPMKKQIEKAIELGLEQICFTDHLDLEYPEQYGYFDLEVEDYVKEVLLMKDKYKDKIDIYLGIEFGLISEDRVANQYDKLANKYPFDFILGSTHIIQWEDPYFPDYWEGKSAHQGIVEYFNTVLDNIRTYHNYDSLGHLDYIIRYASMPEHPRIGKDLVIDHFEYKEYQDVLDEILGYLIKNDKALEVNTGGYKYGLGAPNPGHNVIKRYKEMGGDLITIGADAHKPEYLAYNFDKVKQLLGFVGYKYYVIYENRKPRLMKL